MGWYSKMTISLLIYKLCVYMQRCRVAVASSMRIITTIPTSFSSLHCCFFSPHGVIFHWRGRFWIRQLLCLVTVFRRTDMWFLQGRLQVEGVSAPASFTISISSWLFGWVVVLLDVCFCIVLFYFVWICEVCYWKKERDTGENSVKLLTANFQSSLNTA